MNLIVSKWETVLLAFLCPNSFAALSNITSSDLMTLFGGSFLITGVV